MEIWKYAGGTIEREERIGPKGGIYVRWIATRNNGELFIFRTLTEAQRFLREQQRNPP